MPGPKPKERGAPCKKCGAPCELWHAVPRLKTGGTWDCQMCARVAYLRYRFDIGVEQYNALFAEQAGRCAICLNECALGNWLAVDHSHATGAVRGLLCRNCNVGLGYFDDDVTRLRAAIRYLQVGSENAE